MTSTPRRPRRPDHSPDRSHAAASGPSGPSGPVASRSHVLKLRTPGDLVALLPYQLGYHPRDSGVVVCWHGRRQGLVQRVDLPPQGAEREVADLLLPVLLREQPAAVTLIGYEDTAEASTPLLQLVTEECALAGIAVRDHLVVAEGRWRSLVCTDPGCCPAEGTSLPQPADVPAVVEMVARGVNPAVDRQELRDRLTGNRPLLQRAVHAEALQLLDRLPARHDDDRLRQWREEALRSWSLILGGVDPEAADAVGSLAPSELARAALALVDVELRDAVIAWITPGNLPLDLIDPVLLEQVRRHLPSPQALAGSSGDPVSGDSSSGTGDGGQPGAEPDEASLALGRAIENRLVDFCAVLPAQWEVPPLTVLAAHTWWRGDGALTRIALELALAGDPGYRLAQLLLAMVDRAVRPGERVARSTGPGGSAA